MANIVNLRQQAATLAVRSSLQNRTIAVASWWLEWFSLRIQQVTSGWFQRDRRLTISSADHDAGKTVDRRLILVPCNCKQAYAYWEVSEADKQELHIQGGKKLTLRLYDITNLDIEAQTPHLVQHFDCPVDANDRCVPIWMDDRDYIAELGYITDNGRWLTVVWSTPVHIPACPPAKVGFEAYEDR